MSNRRSFVLCGGGTAGHAMPAIAVGRELRKLMAGFDFIYIGAPGSIEERLAVGEGFDFQAIKISPLRRGVILPNLMVPYRAVASVIEAMWVMKRRGTIGVFGSGGFSSWPATAAANGSGISYFLEDGNALPGLVTRLLHKRAQRLYFQHVETGQRLKAPDRRVALYGIPVSSSIFPSDKAKARTELGLDPSKPTLLLTGGSGGAKRLNQALDESRSRLIAEGWNIIWQTGKQMETLPEVSAELKNRMIISRFFDPAKMAIALQAADVSINRCGMMTLAELAIMGLPSILVPFPLSAEGHQEANAKAVEAAGAGVMVKDSEFDSARLVKELTTIWDSSRYDKMASAMLDLARPEAAKRIAEDIVKTLGL